MRKIAAIAALLVGIASIATPQGEANAQAGAPMPACTQFRFTDPSTSRTGQVCLTLARPLASPSVYCEGRNCVVTARPARFKPGAIAKLRAGGGRGTSGDDICIIYKTLDPWTGKRGEVCFPGDLSAGSTVCSDGSAVVPRKHCVVVVD